MADDDTNPISAFAGDGSEPWALEETQEDILQQLRLYVSRNANVDTQNIKSIAKNVAEMLDKTDEVEQLEKIFQEAKDQGDKLDIQYQAEKQSWLKQQANAKALAESIETEKERQERDDNAVKKLQAEANRAGHSLANLSDRIVNFDGDFSSVLLKLGIFGTVLGGLVKFGTMTVDAYREMNMVGTNFNNNMIRMSMYASVAGMSIQDLSKFVQKNSKIVAAAGVEVVTSTAGAVRDLTKESGNLGFSIEALNDFTASYMEQQKIRNFYDSMTTDERNKRTVDYVKNLKRLSEMTGQSADEIDKQRRSLDKQVELQVALGMMSAEEAKRFNLGLEGMRNELGKLPESTQTELQATMANFARTGNMATTELGRTISRFPELSSAFEEASKLAMAGDAEGAQKAMAKFNDRLKILNQNGTINAQMFGKNNQALQSLLEASTHLKTTINDEELQRRKQYQTILQEQEIQLRMNDLRKQEKYSKMDEKKLREEANKQLQEEQKNTKNMLQAQEALKEAFSTLQNIISDALVKSGILPLLAKWTTQAVESFVLLVKEIKGMDLSFDGVIKLLSDKIGGFLGDIGFWTAIFAGVGTVVAASLVGIFKGLVGKVGGMIFGGGGGGDGKSGGILGSLLGGVGTGIGAILTGLATGIAAFGNLQVVAGAAVLTGIATVAIPAIAAAIAAAAWVMNKMDFGASLAGMSEGLDAFAKVDGVGLMGTAAGITAMALAFGPFAVGGTIATVLEKIGGDSLKSMATTLLMFAEISGEALIETAKGMANIALSINEFAGAAFFSDIDDMEDGVNVLKDLADLGPGLDRTAEALKKMASAFNVLNPNAPELENSIFDSSGDRAGKVLARQVIRSTNTVPNNTVNVNTQNETRNVVSSINDAISVMVEMKKLLETTERRIEVGNMLLADIRSYSDNDSKTSQDILRETRRAGRLN